MEESSVLAIAGALFGGFGAAIMSFFLLAVIIAKIFGKVNRGAITGMAGMVLAFLGIFFISLNELAINPQAPILVFLASWGITHSTMTPFGVALIVLGVAVGFAGNFGSQRHA